MAEIIIISPAGCGEVSQWTDFQRNFALHEAARQRVSAQDVFIDYLNLTPSKVDHSIPAPVIFEWEYRGFAPKSSLLEIYDAVSGKMVLKRRCKGTKSRVYNFEAGKKYTFTISSGKVCASGCFTTANEIPRWINIPGATNVRDLGGRKTIDGKMVRQGLLFRGSEFDRHHFLKPAGRKELLERIGLKSDLDVRGGTEIAPGYVPPLDQEKVRWVNIQLRPYDMIFDDEQKERYAKCLKHLSKAENLPSYFHCWGCADRGGTLAFLLLALLGVPESELLADYEFTTCSVFSERKVGFKQFVTLLETLDTYADNMKDAAEKYFLDGGATKEDISNFRKLMLEA